jgi:hypothetical protein
VVLIDGVCVEDERPDLKLHKLIITMGTVDFCRFSGVLPKFIARNLTYSLSSDSTLSLCNTIFGINRPLSPCSSSELEADDSLGPAEIVEGATKDRKVSSKVKSTREGVLTEK